MSKTKTICWEWFGWTNMMALVEMKSEKWPRNAIPSREKGEKKKIKKGKGKFKDSSEWEYENLNLD